MTQPPIQLVLAPAEQQIKTGQMVDGAVNSAKILDQGIANIDLGYDVGRQNLLTNGGFEIWQRGSGPFASGVSMGPDRWTPSAGSGGGISVSQDNGNVDNYSKSSVQVVASGLGAGGAYAAFIQDIKMSEIGMYVGTTISVSIRVRASAAGSISLSLLVPTVASGPSVSNVQSGVFETLSLTWAMPAGMSPASYLRVQISPLVNGTYNVDNAMLVKGSVPAEYVPMHPADDLARCLRYYEIIGLNPPTIGGSGTNILCGTSYAAGAGSPIYIPVLFKVIKAVTPTVTKLGTWAVTNCGQPSAGGGGLDPTGFQLSAAASAAGTFYFFAQGVNGGASVEANP